MAHSVEQFGKAVMSGKQQGFPAAVLRTVMGIAEPVYTGIVATRNAMFDRGRKTIHRLPRPVISIGNITTGGTGKTPVVVRLAERLRTLGHRPAILLRGYKSKDGLSDEAAMMDRLLNANDPQAPVHVEPDPDRVAGGTRVLARHDDIDCFLLDDGFQHRRLHRDFDLVLINAVEPFGYGHVIPRGLLREPLSGLARANAFLITHASEVTDLSINDIESTLRRYNPTVPIYRCDHVHTGIRSSDVEQPIASLADSSFFVFAGIGNPASLEASLSAYRPAGRKWFGDHHAYTPADLRDLVAQARAAGATRLLTTEKDWAKLMHLPQAQNCELPILRVQLGLRFNNDDENRLIEEIEKCLTRSTATATAASKECSPDAG